MRKLKNDELNRLDPVTYRQAQKLPITVVLDNIRSMHNVGAVFRTCDAFRIQHILLVGITAQPPHREIHKAALGATETVEWSYCATPEEALDELTTRNYQILAIEQTTSSQSLESFVPTPDNRYALILGNEVSGVHDTFIKRAETCIEIPQFGTKHSLNVSVTAGIVLWEFFRKMDGQVRMN